MIRNYDPLKQLEPSFCRLELFERVQIPNSLFALK